MKVHGRLMQARFIEIHQVLAKENKVGYFFNRVVLTSARDFGICWCVISWFAMCININNIFSYGTLSCNPPGVMYGEHVANETWASEVVNYSLQAILQFGRWRCKAYNTWSSQLAHLHGQCVCQDHALVRRSDVHNLSIRKVYQCRNEKVWRNSVCVTWYTLQLRIKDTNKLKEHTET